MLIREITEPNKSWAALSGVNLEVLNRLDEMKVYLRIMADQKSKTRALYFLPYFESYLDELTSVTALNFPENNDDDLDNIKGKILAAIGEIEAGISQIKNTQ